jgi:hypothetical protein
MLKYALGAAALALALFSVVTVAPMATAFASHNGPFLFQGKGPGGDRGNGVLARVTSVQGNTIQATSYRGATVTITVSGATTYTMAGQKASLSDVHNGSIIAVQGTSTGTSSYNATAITIILPRVGGQVTGVQGSTITLAGPFGVSRTVQVNGNTRYLRAGKAASLSDVKVGSRIEAEGNTTGNGTLQALVVQIELPHLAGKVTAINGSSFTVQTLRSIFKGGAATTVTVTTSGATTYVSPNNASASASSIKVGSYIVAEGTLSSDGKTLAAERIEILPAPGTAGRFGHFFGLQHGFGFGNPGLQGGFHGLFRGGGLQSPFGGREWQGGRFFDRGRFAPGGNTFSTSGVTNA